jgi:translation elongation factor EF-Tu-like GTPase
MNQSLVIRASVRLLSSSDGGRDTPIRSGYRPSFFFGRMVGDVRSMSDGSIELVGKGTLAPGESGDALIHPHDAAAWASIESGDRLDFFEGARKIGTAIVQSLIRINVQ